MNRKLPVLLFSLVTLGLVSCGGGNDVASSGATPVSAATSVTTPDVISNTTAATLTVPTLTKPKINGQIDERTGVAPLAAQMTVGSGGSCANNGVTNVQADLPCSVANCYNTGVLTDSLPPYDGHAYGYCQKVYLSTSVSRVQCRFVGGYFIEIIYSGVSEAKCWIDASGNANPFVYYPPPTAACVAYGYDASVCGCAHDGKRAKSLNSCISAMSKANRDQCSVLGGYYYEGAYPFPCISLAGT